MEGMKGEESQNSVDLDGSLRRGERMTKTGRLEKHDHDQPGHPYSAVVHPFSQ